MTVGSNPWFTFDRLLDGLASLPGEDLVVQYGPGKRPPHARHAVPWMSFAETLEHIDKASAIIGHAGAGTILSAVRAGHVPIAMPRLKEFDEAIDDHQLYFARALSASGRIILVEKPDEIPAGVSQVPVRGSAVTPGEGGLVAAVRAELHRPRRDES